MTDPITKTLTVPLSPKRAFDLFTDEMADWWPLDSHSLSAGEGKPARSVHVTPEVGGEVTETRHDGSKARWGKVTEWQPGKSFGMTWRVGRPAEQASHVSVSFDVVADGTRVTLIHDNWQALGAEAAQLRAGYFTVWDGVFLGHFAKACRRVAVMA